MVGKAENHLRKMSPVSKNEGNQDKRPKGSQSGHEEEQAINSHRTN